MTKEYDLANAPFSWDKLDGLLAIKMSLIVCAEILGTTNTTIKNHIRKRYDLTFTEYAERKLSPTKVRLVQKAIQMAMAGDRTMLIFSLKNLCKWSDNNDQQVDIGKIQINIDKIDSNL